MKRIIVGSAFDLIEATHRVTNRRDVVRRHQALFLVEKRALIHDCFGGLQNRVVGVVVAVCRRRICIDARQIREVARIRRRIHDGSRQPIGIVRGLIEVVVARIVIAKVVACRPVVVQPAAQVVGVVGSVRRLRKIAISAAQARFRGEVRVRQTDAVPHFVQSNRFEVRGRGWNVVRRTRPEVSDVRFPGVHGRDDVLDRQLHRRRIRTRRINADVDRQGSAAARVSRGMKNPGRIALRCADENSASCGNREQHQCAGLKQQRQA